jgi:hypothetical protein
MELDKLSTGEKISAASAIALFILMFFGWFSYSVSGVEGFSGEIPGSASVSAWNALDLIAILLMAAVVAAVGVAIVRLTDADLEPSFSLNTIVTVLGALAVLLILFRIISPPGYDNEAAFTGISIDGSPKIWAFLGLIAAAGIAYGGYSAMREEGTTFGDAADRLSGGGGGGAAPGPGPGGEPPPPPPPPPAPGGQAPGQQAPPPPQQQPPPPPAPEPPQQPPAPPPPQQQPPPPPPPPQG